MPVDHYENFPVASILLPAHLREPIEAIYHFARGADDIADEGNLTDEVRLAELSKYNQELDKIESGKGELSPLFLRLSKTIHEWNLPIYLFRDLIDAFSQDVVKKRYQDFPELLDYCRRSANPVGRLLLYLFKCTDEESLKQSDLICSALQLINFWQDVGVDWKKERVYIPQNDLKQFNISENQIAQSEWTSQWADLIGFEVQRARQMMLEGAPLVRKLPGRMGLEIRLTIQGGLKILDKIDAVQGNVFKHRPALKPLDWLSMGTRALFM